MFSDRYRSAKMAVCLCLLVWLGLAYAHAAIVRPEGYRAAAAAPEEHEGAPLIFPLWTVTRLDGPDGYAISRTIKKVPVVGDTQGLALGDTVTLKGAFRAADSAVVVRERIDHPLRPLKAGLSVLALIWAVAMAPRVFAWRERRWVLRG
jgi:hypothetical protein